MREPRERSQSAITKDHPNSRYGTLAPIDLKKKGKNLRSPTSPNVESSPALRRDHDPEEDHTHHQKKSVLTKVKERAKKLRHGLSGKKKHSEEGSTKPAWGVSLEDEEEEEDAEYLGAPMYESEVAPEGYKVYARHHPREIPVISEKQVLASSVNHGVDEQEKEKPPASTSPKQPTTSNKTITETITDKLAPAYATVSDATHAIASKIQGLTVSSPAAPEVENLPALETKKPASPTGNTWNRSVSVKEFLRHKFEPGKDERALSQVVTEAMSPQRSPGKGGVLEKVKEAVTSYLWKEESSISSPSYSALVSSPSIPVSTNAYEVFEEEENHGRILQAN